MGNIHLVTGHAGAAHVTAADHGSLNAAILGEGQVVLDRGNKLAATVISNNEIKIADGDIMMQGRHIRLNEGDSVSLTIENGEQGMSRNDLIVCRYTMNTLTGIEEANLVVIKGTSAASNPMDPDYTSADIITDHAFLADMLLYRVPIVDLNVGELVPLFKVAGKMLTEAEKGAANGVATLDGKGKVPSKQLPSMDYIPNNAKGAAGGVASLGTDGKVPESQLPELGSTNLYGTEEYVDKVTPLADGVAYFMYEE